MEGYRISNRIKYQVRWPVLFDRAVKNLFYLFIAASSIPSFAQNLPGRQYTTADGLVADRVTCAVQDDQGFMWFGTYFGISRYDGYQFTTIPLPEIQQNKYVSTLCTANGKVYAGFWFEGGLMEYSNGKATAYLLPEGNQKGSNITALVEHPVKGLLVAGGGNSVYHFIDGKFNFLFALDSNFTNIGIACLSIDRQGNIWAGTLKGLAVYTTAGRLLKLSEKNTIYLREHASGMLVLSGNGRDYQVQHYTRTADSFALSKNIWRSRTVLPILQNSFHHDKIWIADTSNRFICITPDGKANLSSSEDISGNDIHFIYADREHNLWIATHTGIVKMANLPALAYAFPVKAFGVADISGTDSLLWISNSQSLFTIQQQQLRKVPEFRSTVKRDLFGRIYSDGKYVWASGWQG